MDALVSSLSPMIAVTTIPPRLQHHPTPGGWEVVVPPGSGWSAANSGQAGNLAAIAAKLTGRQLTKTGDRIAPRCQLGGVWIATWPGAGRAARQAIRT